MFDERTRQMRLIKAMGAVIVMAAVVAGPPWALVRFIGNPWPAEGISLSAPLTDGAIIGLLAAVVWLLWAQLVACILVEAIAALTDDRIQVRVPFTLAAQQHFARRMITALMLVAVSTSASASPAHASITHVPTTEKSTPATALGLAAVDHRTGQQTVRDAGDTLDAADVQAEAGRGHPTVTVMRLDSLWSIAERVLGDGDRWPEIAALNEGRTMSDGSTFISADHIRPGWQLQIPDSGQHGTHQSRSDRRD